MANWAPYSEAKGEPAGLKLATPAAAAVAPSAGTTPEAVCTECGGIFPIENMIRYGNAHVCANCKPVFMQKLAEGARVDIGEMNYAGFWIRVLARIVDGLILGIPFGVLFFAVAFSSIDARDPSGFNAVVSLGQLGFIAIQMFYDIFFIGKFGATPGKMVCKIKVVTSEGARVSYARATGRFFAEKLSAIACYIGYIMVAFDAQKRGLHDHICNTRVVYK
jgi:uncharacterized RDD family membrane protein YckC